MGSLISKSITASLFILLFSSCATIFNGSCYVANVKVTDHSNASIRYDGIERGIGEASFKVRRLNTDKLNIIVKDKNCETQVFTYKHREIQGWTIGIPLGISSPLALSGGIGVAAMSASITNGIGVSLICLLFTAGPFLAVDAMTGAYWHPSVSSEKGVIKVDNNHYNYLIDYTGCNQDKK